MSDAPKRIWAWDDRTPTERDKGWSACDAGTGSTEYIRADLVPAPSEALLIAASELVDGAYSTYKSRNGREVSIEADDGEKCLIVHSDLLHQLESAKAAAQADYEARIMASIQIAPTPGWQTIKSAPVGIPVLAYCYGGEVLMTRITKHGEDEYARNPDLWMPLPKPPTKDSTHD